MRSIGEVVFLLLFFLLGAAWLGGWLLFHVAGGAIHLLLVIALVSLVVHVFRGRATV